MPSVACKRIYDSPAPGDGYRVLIDRLWPRGISKDAAAIDEWAKDLAPSQALRKQFDHQAERWPDFCSAYADELAGQGVAIRALWKRAGQQNITLLFAARDTEHNNAVAFAAILQQYCSKQR